MIPTFRWRVKILKRDFVKFPPQEIWCLLSHHSLDPADNQFVILDLRQS